MNKVPIFTSSIYTEIIDGLDLDKINQEIFKIQEQFPVGVRKSNFGGWQFDEVNFTYHSEVLESLVEKIIPYMKKATEEYGYKKDVVDVHYWLNVNRKNHYNNLHKHGTAIMSAVFYTKVPNNSGKIVFQRTVTGELECRVDEYNSDNWDEFHVPPKEGLLLMFPGNMKHLVERNLTDDEDDRRVSIALNLYKRT
jgi:uncharacterized protein (TIGR02466 family)